MPTVPPNPLCSDLGCKNPRSKLNSRCIVHGGMDSVPTREVDSIYQTPAWKSIRARQMSIQPLCESCISRGKLAQAEHVDHVFAWKHIGRQAFTANLFQSLCKPCHSVKTGIEKRGRYVHYRVNGPIEYKLTDYAGVMGQLCA